MARLRRHTTNPVAFGDRSSLIADLSQQKHEQQVADAQARQKEDDAYVKQQREKAAQKEAAAQDLDNARELANSVIAGAASLKDLKELVDTGKKKHASSGASFDSILRQAAQGLDKQKAEDFKSGAISLDDFETYIKGRKSEGIYAQNSDTLLGQARKYEDDRQFKMYDAGAITYDKFKQYATKRLGSGDNSDIVQGYLAKSKSKEDSIQDQTKAAQYEAGTLTGDDFKTYLKNRLTTEQNPKTAAEIRTAMKKVETNEVNGAAQKVVDDLQSGAIDAGTATTRLRNIASTTTDAALQTKIHQTIDGIKRSSASAAASASAAESKAQTAANSMFTKAQTQLSKDVSEAKAGAAKGNRGDFGSIAADIINAYNLNTQFLDTLAKSAPDPKLFLQTAALNMNRRSGEVRNAAETIAQNMKDQGTSAAFLIGEAATHPGLNPSDVKSLYQQGIQQYNQMRKSFLESPAGAQWQTTVNHIARALAGNKDALQQFSSTFGVNPKDEDSFRAAVEQAIAADPDQITKILRTTGAMPELTDRAITVEDDQGGTHTATRVADPLKFAVDLAKQSSDFKKLQAAQQAIFGRFGKDTPDLESAVTKFSINNINQSFGASPVGISDKGELVFKNSKGAVSVGAPDFSDFGLQRGAAFGKDEGASGMTTEERNAQLAAQQQADAATANANREKRMASEEPAALQGESDLSRFGSEGGLAILRGAKDKAGDALSAFAPYIPQIAKMVGDQLSSARAATERGPNGGPLGSAQSPDAADRNRQPFVASPDSQDRNAQNNGGFQLEGAGGYIDPFGFANTPSFDHSSLDSSFSSLVPETPGFDDSVFNQRTMRPSTPDQVDKSCPPGYHWDETIQGCVPDEGDIGGQGSTGSGNLI